MQTLARPLATCWRRRCRAIERFDAIAPTPLHWRRRWHRGFNQAELLAGRLARRTGIPVMRALRRVQLTQTQAGLSNTDRRRNVAHGLSRAGAAAAIEGKRILLMDDVMTTGSTAAACAAALEAGGRGTKVALLTIARVDRRFEFGRCKGAIHTRERTTRWRANDCKSRCWC